MSSPPHVHLPLPQLLELVAAQRRARAERDTVPEWLRFFISETAELFEPNAGVARVGYCCRPGEGEWRVAFYLGFEEQVGGRDDGRCRRPGFQFDLDTLFTRFDSPPAVAFEAPQFEEDRSPGPRWVEGSFVTLRGEVSRHSLVVQIRSLPPAEAGPGIRRAVEDVGDGRGGDF